MIKHKPYLLTAHAKHSLQEARKWSRSRWGSELTKCYFQDLEKAACYVAHNQSMASSSHTIEGLDGIGVYPVREHYLIYVALTNEQIAIVDVIRQTRDVPTLLAKHAPQIKRELISITRSANT